MIDVLQLQHPWRCSIRTGALRDRFQKNEQPDRWDTFSKHFKAALGGYTMTPHAYSKNTFGHRNDTAKVWGETGRVTKLLSDLGFQSFINSGTLLGMVREGKLLEHDDDIDLGLIVPGDSLEAVYLNWEKLRKALLDLGVLDPNFKPNKSATPMYKLRLAGSIEVDLFPCWVIGEQVFVYPHTYGTIHKDDLLPLQPLENQASFMPRKPEKMLEQNYGHDWRIPDPYARFNWQQAFAKFSDFLSLIEEGLPKELKPKQKEQKTVLTYGTFDLFHVGHVRLLKRLAALGDRLIVACSTDEFNVKKGKRTVIPYKHRVEILKSCRFVDKVIMETDWNQKTQDVKEHDIDIFAMGDDWEGQFDFLKPYCEVVYLARTENVSTTNIREYIQARQ